MGSSWVMAIDIGVASVKVGLVDQRGLITHYTVQQLASIANSIYISDVLLKACSDLLGRANITTKEILAVGCCTAGSLDPQSGVIVASNNRDWEGVDVRTPLEQSFERQITVVGEGNAAALAAYTFGPVRGQSPLLAIQIGSGIACGFMDNGRLLEGAGNAALEAGHIPLFYQGRLCSCGRRGCWEAHASGRALTTLLSEYRELGHPLPADPEALAELARAGDELALKVWDEQGTVIGLGIAVLLNVLNPRTVVLGGGMLKSWALFKKSLLKTAREQALVRNAESAIVCATEPERTSLLGVAVAAVIAQGPADFFIPGET
jgi:predicted NBD/HSP70 family sugar kinase